jgi:hypothetical protein
MWIFFKWLKFIICKILKVSLVVFKSNLIISMNIPNGVLLSFQIVFFFCYFSICLGWHHNLSFYYYFGWKNCWHVLYTCQRVGGVVHFKRRARFPRVKIMILLCHFVLLRILFPYRWCVSPKNCQWPFPPFSSLSPTPKQLNLSLIFVDVSESILLVLIFFLF